FFQAEDGIRDFHVTGVQTCALPIFPHLAMGARADGSGATSTIRPPVRIESVAAQPAATAWRAATGEVMVAVPWRTASRNSATMQIGRASCRERVQNTVAVRHVLVRH